MMAMNLRAYLNQRVELNGDVMYVMTITTFFMLGFNVAMVLFR